MKHTICINASELCQILKDATIYAGKDEKSLNVIVLAMLPKIKKLAVIACDGFGYYERHLRLEINKSLPKPSLPGKEMRLIIPVSEVSMLAKFLASKINGLSRLEIDDEAISEGKYSVRITLPNGHSATFFSPVNIELPNFSSIKSNALKGKKKPTTLENINIPVKELMRLGKVLPNKSAFASMFTSPHQSGLLALLECNDETTDLSVIFMLNPATPQNI